MMHCRNEIPLALSCDGIRSAHQFFMKASGLKGDWGLGIFELRWVVCVCFFRGFVCTAIGKLLD
jgi:hypothetical protein